MVVNDRPLLWSGGGPHEADPPLVVDPDAVLTGPITFECLQSVARWDMKVIERHRGSQLTKLAQSDSMDSRVDRAHSFPEPQPFGVLAAERPDHTAILYRDASITLDVKPELHHVAVTHHVVLALDPYLAGGARGDHRAGVDQIVVRHHFRLDETALEIGV